MNQSEMGPAIDEIMKIRDKDERDEKLVDFYMSLDNSHPKDTSLKLIGLLYPKENHENLGLIGQFHSEVNVEVLTEDGYKGIMDQAYRVTPEGELNHNLILNPEYQATIPDKYKKEQFLVYHIGAIYKHGINFITCIVGNFNNELGNKQAIELDEQLLNVLVRDFDDEEVKETLNIITDKVNKQEEFFINDTIKFTYVVTFPSKEINKDIVRKAIDQFNKAKINDPKVKGVVRRTIICMTRYAFENETQEARRLLKMIVKNMGETEVKETPFFFKIEQRFKETDRIMKVWGEEIAENKKAIAKKDKTILEQEKSLEEKDVTIAEDKKTIAEKDMTIAEDKKTIAEKDMTIAEKDETIAEKDMTIAEKDETIAEKDMTIAEKDETIAEKDETIRIMRKKIEMLEKQVQSK